MEALAKDILGKLKKDWQLNMQMFCGQGYDGAGVMAGKQKGVAARIMNKYPKALYTHCASHVLNLCIVEATNIADVRNMMNIASCVARFFNNSPKRQLAFDKFIDEQHQVAAHSSKRAKLKDLCKTRWVERHDAFEALHEFYTATVFCLEAIANSSSSVWNRDTLADANSYLRALTEFRFIITLVITKNVLAYTKDLSVKLQGRWQDIARAYKDIKLVKESISKARGSIDSFHCNWY